MLEMWACEDDVENLAEVVVSTLPLFHYLKLEVLHRPESLFNLPSCEYKSRC